MDLIDHMWKNWVTNHSKPTWNIGEAAAERNDKSKLKDERSGDLKTIEALPSRNVLRHECVNL